MRLPAATFPATRPVSATSRNAAGLRCTLSAGSPTVCTLSLGAEPDGELAICDAVGAYDSCIVLVLRETGLIV